ncbi:hypothetical protein L2D14_11695 [Thalassospiraceae bacterium LMO-JJ14]|nr:hypothetical protein L2D14_11695 [Thalassospiraceae bacterium LMO-JJ14]
MSLSVDSARYFIPGYVSQNQLAQPDSSGSDADPVTANVAQDQASVAPPPISGKPLLASNDLRLLMLRGVDQGGVEGYKDILNAFYADPENRNDPVSFLNKLSPDGIALLKQAQSLPAGASINVDSLNKEEALNLILPHSGQVDLNNDGLIANANGGKGFMFPPPNAPQNVKDAWAGATNGLSDSDKFLLSGKFMLSLMSANLHVDENGKATQTEPGDPGWRNVFAEDGYSYQVAIERFKAGNESNKPYNSNEIYERTKKLLAQLDRAFDKHDVA